MDVGRRLQSALDGRDMSIRGFHKAMSSRGEKGSSYPQVHRYLKGKAEPSLAFLRCAAEVLNIRESWLAFGHGQMTDAEERVDAIWEESRDGGELTRLVREEVPWLSYGPSPATHAFWEILRQVARHRMRESGPEDPGLEEHLVETAKEIEQYLRCGMTLVMKATVDSSGKSGVGAEPGGQSRLAILHALILAMPDWVIRAQG